MEQKDFDKYFSKKSVSDLLKQVSNHIQEIDKLNPMWYDALIQYLCAKELTDIQKKEFSLILNTDFEVLKLENQNKSKNQNKSHKDYVLSNPYNIVKAGKHIKNITYSVQMMFLVTFFGYMYIRFINLSLEEINTVWSIVGFIIFICNGFIMYCIHSAGDNLQKSIR